MKAHYFKHVPFEDLGSIRSWLMKDSYTITCTPFLNRQIFLLCRKLTC